jgi:hypothetical protein
MKVSGTPLCILAIALLAGSAGAQSTKPAMHSRAKRSSGSVIGHAPKASAAPRPNIAKGPNGHPCPVGPMRASHGLANVKPSAALLYHPAANPADDNDRDKEPIVLPVDADPPSSEGGGGDGDDGSVDSRKLPTPYPTHHPTLGPSSAPASSTQHQGTQTTVTGAGTQDCPNGR